MNTQKSRIEELHQKFTSGILGFWIREYRISYLIVITIIIMGSIAIMGIPKESSPAVKLGIISISTSYFGANPVDIDALVTDKIYKAVKDVKGVDKITSSSSLGMSSLSLTLKTSADTKEAVNDVRNAVNKVTLPSDAKTPVVTEVETDTNQAFSIFVYSHDQNASKAILFDRAITLQKAIEKVSGINKVTLSAGGTGDPVASGGGNSAMYDVDVIFPQEKLDSLGLTLSSIASTISAYNRDQPIGNFALGDKKYDFRLEGKSKDSFDFLDLPISLPNGATMKIGDIATIERKYKNDSINTIVLGGSTGATVSGEVKNAAIAFPYVGLTVNKTDSANIFAASDAAKKVVAEYFLKDEFKNFGYTFGIDLADNIRDDYAELLKEAITTLILVFIAMYAFVGFRDSLFASLTLPLAFLSTFILLYAGGYTMNFLTNFSLILSFGIAIDTIIVIVQAASAKLRVGYDPQSAIMLALREYATPIISGVMTTIVVFIPMMFLPGILGKFLAYIPITIFGVLATGLILALTVNSALYLIFVKRRNSYVDDPHAIEYATDEEKELLLLEREGKERIDEYKAPLRIRLIHKMTSAYKDILRLFLESTFLRRTAIIIPIILLILSFIFLAPKVGFDIFPGDDNAMTTFTITGPIGQKTEITKKELKGVEKIFLGYPEIKYTTVSVAGNTATISLQLTKKDVRKKLGQMDVFALEDVLLPKLQIYEEKGYKVISVVAKNGPPGSKAVGLKLIVDNPDKLSTLISVSKDFETYLKTIHGTKNVSRSSQDTPGQFIFTLKKDLLATLGVSPAVIYAQITQTINGVTVGSVEDNGDDMDVILKSSKFGDNIRMEDILSIPITIGQNTFLVSDLVDDKIDNSTALISRDDGNIEITVDADLETGIDSVSTQSAFVKFAESYKFPSGVSYLAGGENEANSELITAVLSSFFIALIVIFAILTMQFQSFSQPGVILYSVIMALPFVMLGLLLTGNKFSLPFGIGFIAFTGIAVNHGIILIAAINENLKKGVEGITALVEAGSSRLEPMLLTTITTVLGIFPIALRDKFWSGMGFTIIFGIMAASFLTLFVLKGIYYEMFLIPKKPSRIKKIFGKLISLFKKNPPSSQENRSQMNSNKSNLPLILLTAFLDILGVGILIPILPDIIIHFGVSESWNPYSQGIYSIGMFIGGFLFGSLSDRFGRKRMLSVTSSFNLLGYIVVWISLSTNLISFPLSVMFLLFLTGRIISGLGGAGYGVVQAYIADISNPENRTKNMGLIGAMFGLGFLVGPAIGGILGSYGGPQSVLLACICAVALNLLLIIFVLPEPKKHQREMAKEITPFHFSKLTLTLLGLSFGASLAFSSVQSGMGQWCHDIIHFSADQIGGTMAVVGIVAILYQGALMKYVRAFFSEIEMVRWALLLMMISLALFAINRSSTLVYFIVALFPLAMGTFQPGINSLIASKAGKEVGKVMGYNTSVTSIAGIIGPLLVGTLYAINPTIPFYASAGFAFLMFLISIFMLKNHKNREIKDV